MNKKNKILILFLFPGLILIFLICSKFNISCLFKQTFNIPCPACGITRALREIFNLNIIKSFKYNILAFPTFIVFIIFFISTIIDIIFNKNIIIKLSKITSKYYYIIIILLTISWIINIYRNI